MSSVPERRHPSKPFCPWPTEAATRRRPSGGKAEEKRRKSGGKAEQKRWQGEGAFQHTLNCLWCVNINKLLNIARLGPWRGSLPHPTCHSPLATSHSHFTMAMAFTAQPATPPYSHTSCHRYRTRSLARLLLDVLLMIYGRMQTTKRSGAETQKKNSKKIQLQSESKVYTFCGFSTILSNPSPSLLSFPFPFSTQTQTPWDRKFTQFDLLPLLADAHDYCY